MYFVCFFRMYAYFYILFTSRQVRLVSPPMGTFGPKGIFFFSERMRISTYTTAQRILFPSGRVRYMKWALVSLQLGTFGPNWALGQLMFGHICYTLEIVMASVAKMSSSETEKYGHGTTISAFVF